MKEKFTKNSGIYCFENLINNKKYVGQADNLNRRISRHLSALKKGYDCCVALQHSWTFYGGENFIVYIIEECKKESLNQREIFWIKELHSHVLEGGLNISLGGEAFMRGRNHTEESKQNISKNSATPLGKDNYMFNRERTDGEKEKISIGLKKYYESHEQPRKGIPQTKEHIKKRFDKIKKNREKFLSGTEEIEINERKYFGVSYDKRYKAWTSKIRRKNKVYYLGSFETELEAALAYNKKSLELDGENAKLNVIEEDKYAI